MIQVYEHSVTGFACMQVGDTEKAFILLCHSGVNTFTLKGIQLLDKGAFYRLHNINVELATVIIRHALTP